MQLPKGSFDYLLVDGNKVPEGLHVPAEAVVKGDSKSSCIAAASIIAKVGIVLLFGSVLPRGASKLRHGDTAQEEENYPCID